MNRRIAVVCPIASGGGISEAFLASLDMLRDQGHTPLPIVPAGFKLLDQLHSRGFDPVTINGLERGGAFNLLRQALLLAGALRKLNVSIALVNNGRHVRLLKLLCPHLPLVAVYHGGKTVRYLKADRVITINDEQLAYLKAAGYADKRAVAVDNVVPLNILPPYRPKTRQVPGPVVGTLRLLEPAKGVDILIEAIGILARQGRRYHTRIGSGGSQATALKARVAALGLDDLIEFAGWVADKDAFYASLDLYVLPSRHEEWGIGIVEANVARLPVIATACVGPRRIVRPEITGLLVPVADAAAMAAAIARLADDPDLAERLARQAYAHCEQHYLFPRIAPVFAREVCKVLVP